MITVSNDVLKYKDIINNLYEKNGNIPHQSYSNLKALQESKDTDEFVLTFYQDIDCLLISAFERIDDSMWKCTIPGYPLLYEGNVEVKNLTIFLESLIKALNTDCIYFYNIYEEFSLIQKIKNVSRTITWPRLPSPIINWDYGGNNIWGEIAIRYGSRAERQRKRFENKLFVCESNDYNIEENLLRIEQNSWKYKVNQDLTSRIGQISYYSSIIKNKLANITFACDHNDTPVAYRIDSHTKEILYVLKWSYHEEYKRYSPGFYLLTVDLINKWKNKKLKHIDLFGSPDSLKSIMETTRLNRIDLGFPNIDKVNHIRLERLDHDEKLRKNHLLGRSIRSVYL